MSTVRKDLTVFTVRLPHMSDLFVQQVSKSLEKATGKFWSKNATINWMVEQQYKRMKEEGQV